MSDLLFVYGTLLQRGNAFADYLHQHCHIISAGKIKGLLYDTGEYPALVTGNRSEAYVHGSIYQLNNPDKVLKMIDEYEGFGPDEKQPNLFIRVLGPIETQKKVLDAWIYIYNLPLNNFIPIPSGNYMEYLKTKKSPAS